MSAEVEYTLAYFPPEAEVIKSLSIAFPWTQQFVRLKTVGTGKDKVTDSPGKYEDVVLALGELFDHGKDTNSEVIFGMYFEIAAVPSRFSLDFEDIVAGRGDVFKDLNRVVNRTLSGFINAIKLEAVEKGITKENAEMVPEDDNASKILVPDKKIVVPT